MIRIVESGIEFKGQRRQTAQIDLGRDTPPEKRGRPVQAFQDFVATGPAERHHKRRGITQVRADADLGHRDGNTVQAGVVRFATIDQLDQDMPDHFTDTQLPLATGLRFTALHRNNPLNNLL